MTKYAITLFLCSLLMGCNVGKTDLQIKQQDMLYPSVKVSTSKGFGSGVVFYSERGTTLILTANHVVRGKKKVNVTFYPYDDEHKGVVIKRDKEYDLALVAVDYDFPYTVRLGEVRPLQPFEPVYVVGAGSGIIPHPSEGIVAVFDEDILLVTAPITQGNSGGGIFIKQGRHYVYVGMPLAVGLSPQSAIPFPVYHQTFANTLYNVYRFLLEEEDE